MAHYNRFIFQSEYEKFDKARTLIRQALRSGAATVEQTISTLQAQLGYSKIKATELVGKWQTFFEADVAVDDQSTCLGRKCKFQLKCARVVATRQDNTILLEPYNNWLCDCNYFKAKR